MPKLDVTLFELQYLTDHLGALYHWPARSSDIGADALMFIPAEKQDGVGGGPSFRLRVLALYRYSQRNDNRWPVLPLEVSVQELWLLDQMLWSISGDLRQINFKDGQPLVSFAVKVWDALIREHAADLPEHLRIDQEAPNARASTPAHEGTDRGALQDADATIQAVEAALARSRQDKGTATDMPSAAA